MDVDDTIRRLSGSLRASDVRAVRGTTAKARSKDSMRAVAKLTQRVNGTLRIVSAPPLIVPVTELLPDDDARDVETEMRALLAGYQRSLDPDRRHLIGTYRFMDMARKVVGVGSVGTWCALLLLLDADATPLLLQIKEARASALAPFVGEQPFAVPGERVVGGQHAMQAASDPLLGWADLDDRCVYVRQYRDLKAAPDVLTLRADELQDYAMHCAWALARAHARAGDARTISAYIGAGNAFVDAVAAFAGAYADQAAADHAAFVAAAPELSRTVATA
jgi:uncharacterized protein (DUF2252 family)